MQITIENVNELKPGELVKLNGQVVRFKGFGNPTEVIFEPLNASPLSGNYRYDLSFMKPRIVPLKG